MENQSRGLFIALEGIDGAGTTTHAELLRKNLEAVGYSAVLTCEPTTRPIGQLIRKALRKNCGFSGLVMAMLFAADRRDHVNNLILPCLTEGKIVISDRYQLSSLAYQTNETIGPLVTNLACGLIKPDYTFVLDLPVEVAEERRRHRGGQVERYDRIEFQRRVAKKYLQLADQTRTILVINADRHIQEVEKEIWNSMLRLISKTQDNPPTNFARY